MRFQTLYEGRHIFGVLIGPACGGGGPSLVVAPDALRLPHPFLHQFFSAIPIAIFHRVIMSSSPPRTGMLPTSARPRKMKFSKRGCRRVGIFLSVFDVHVNKAPIAGKITYTKHYPGTYPGPYLDARHADVSKFNEALTWAFEGSKATLVVRQITGKIARRIVPWSKVGDVVEKGFRFG
jgi:phosphatidylserine decarboxylase